MKLSITHTKNNTYFYMVKSYRNSNGKSTSKIIEKLGTLEEVKLKAKGEDPKIWAKRYVEEKTREENKNNAVYYEKFTENEELDNSIKIYNLGYLFLKDIFYDLQLDVLCKEISSKNKFEYDLNKILQDLLYTRILCPSSKLSAFEEAQKFIEQPNYELHDVYRALSVIAEKKEDIEKWCYKTSLNVIPERNTKILYYDCTNYFFEVEQEDEDDTEKEKKGLRKYGVNKEHRPLPIVQMGLFMDGSGYPLAFCIHPGNTNEQQTLTPLEKQIMKDFELSRFLVCTDAGLGSFKNRLFNTKGEKVYIVAQSLKNLEKHYQEIALSDKDWHIENSSKKYDLGQIDKYDPNDKNTYYKEFIIERKKKDEKTGEIQKLKERMIVTFTTKYAIYQKSIRDKQISRAKEIIEKHPEKYLRKSQTDAKRFIKCEKITNDGECAEKYELYYKNELEEYEQKFDGMYAVCTPENMDGGIGEIIKINKGRWEIEESFRIIKSEFRARPVYLHREERIIAHFVICFLALLVHRIIDKSKLKENFTTTEIIDTLKNMSTTKIEGLGYKQLYSKSAITETLREAFGFNLDKNFISNKNMKKILKEIEK